MQFISQDSEAADNGKIYCKEIYILERILISPEFTNLAAFCLLKEKGQRKIEGKGVAVRPLLACSFMKCIDVLGSLFGFCGCPDTGGVLLNWNSSKGLTIG
jgi:hypothetical protein